MDINITTIISSLISSVSITAGSAWWLGRRWIDHKLAKAIEQQKFELQKDLEKEKVIWEGDIRTIVENELADKAAQRDYEFAARSRLYTTIGPLRFQLINACRDLALHIKDFHCYSLESTNYYGKSTLYRLILPLTIAELIENQLSIVDFSIDQEAIDLLRFKKAAHQAFCSAKPILDNPKADWDHATEHLFSNLVVNMSSALIVSKEGKPERPMSFREFELYLEQPESVETLGPLIKIIRDFRIDNKTIFWTRLVFYGYASANLVNKMGVKIGFQVIDLNTEKLLTKLSDDFTKNNLQQLCKNHVILLQEGL